jgi:two-component system response regulator YesN
MGKTSAWSPFIYFLKHNKSLIRMLLILIMSCAILLSSLSAFLFSKYSERSIQDTYSISVDQLEQTYRMIDAQLMAVYNYYSRFFRNSSNVFNALYADQFGTEEMYEISKTLIDSMQFSPLVSSVYIINRNADAVFSSGTTVREIGEFYDKDIMDYLNETNEVNNPIFIPRDASFRIYDKWEEHKFISIIFSESSNTAMTDAALIINISLEEIKEMLALESMGNKNQKLIVNYKGTVIIQTDNFASNHELSDEAFFRTIQSNAKDGNSGYFTSDKQGKKHFITYLKSSSILGWYFISIIEYEQLVSRISQLGDTVFLITGIFILISAFISLLFIRSLYKPIHRLIQRVKSEGKFSANSSMVSEFEFLRDAFDHMTTNISGLNHTLNAYRPAKKKELLERLIRNEVYLNKNMEDELQSVGIPPNSEHNLIVILRIDEYKALSERCSLRDIALYRFAISNISRELIEGNYYVEEIESREDTISFLISSMKGKPLLNVKENFKNIQEAVEINVKLSITVGIGTVFSHISEIGKSYYSAINASNSRLRLGRGAIIDQDSVPENGREEYLYPLDLEKKLVDSLKLEDEEKYMRILDKLMQSVSQFTYDEIILSLTQSALAIIKTATGIMQVDPERLGSQRQNIMKQISELDTLNEIRDWYKRLYTAIITVVNERKDSKQEEVIKKVEDYILTHYHDMNLSVESLAEMVYFSPNHLRLIFKKQVGKSISEYITDIRFMHAMQLLRETNDSIKDIAEEVGFANSSYFYTSFKKYTGVSAAQYREDSKERHLIP